MSFSGLLSCRSGAFFAYEEPRVAAFQGTEASQHVCNRSYATVF